MATTKFDIEDEGRLQITAGVALLSNSRLVRWSDRESRFRSVTEKTFEGHSTKSLDRQFGRVMRWILFSAGAEFFVKGACLAHSIEVRRELLKDVPKYPEHLGSWIPLVQDDPYAAGTFGTTDFDTLDRLLRPRPADVSFLKELAAKSTSDPDERARIVAAFGLLTKTIRNRDAHAYVPNVRKNHFELVKILFVPALNMIVDGLPGGGDTLENWRVTHETFIQTLTSTSV